MALTTGQLLTNITNTIKTQYPDIFTNVINTKSPINSIISSKQTIPVGYDYKIGYQTALSEGGAMFGYADALATPGSIATAYLSGTVKHRNVTLQVYGASQAFTNSSEKSFINTVTGEIKAKSEAEGLEQARMWYGDSSGKIGYLAASSAGAHSGGVVTVTLDTGWAGKKATKWIRKGKLVDFYNGSSPVSNGTALKVINVLSDTTFTVAGDGTLATDLTNAGVATTGYVYASGSYTNAEYYGLKNLIGVTTNTVHSVNRVTAGNEFYVPTVYYQASTGPTAGAETDTDYDWLPEDLEQIISKVVVEEGAVKDNFVLVCDNNLELYMVKQQRDYGETVPRGKFVDSWPYETIKFNGIPVVSDYRMWSNTIFGVNKPDLRVFEAQKMDWTPFETGYWLPIPGTNTYYDAYMARGIERKENSVVEPRKSFTYYNVKGLND